MNSFLFLISAFLAVTSAKTSWENLNGYTFENYLQEFNLQYPESELGMRRAAFDSELKRIKEHNAKSGDSWKEGVSKFTVMTPAERKAYFGRSKNAAKEYKNSLKSTKDLPEGFVMKPVSSLPRHVDWREAGIATPVKDQGHCGSCWAFCSTAVLESHVAKASGLVMQLSVQQIASCTPNPNSCGGTGGCNGATAELAFDYASNSRGLYSEYQYPYNSYYGDNYECKTPAASPVAKIDGFVQLPINNYTALMNAVATVGPIAIAVDASTWHAYEGGVFNGCNQVNPDINHGVVLMGYGEDAKTNEKYWLVRNSWSPSWGENGYIRLKRTDNEDTNCGSDITPQDGVACAGQNDPVKVCGTCGVIYDTAYPLNAAAISR